MSRVHTHSDFINPTGPTTPYIVAADGPPLLATPHVPVACELHAGPAVPAGRCCEHTESDEDGYRGGCCYCGYWPE